MTCMIRRMCPCRLRVPFLLLALASPAAHAAARGDAAPAALPGRPAPREGALLEKVYAGHEGPLWSGASRLTPQGAALAATLLRARDFGLNPRDYAAASIAALEARLAVSAAPPLADRMRFDVALTRAAIRLVSNLHYGRVDPRAAGFDIGPRREDLDVAATVRALASATDVARALAAVEPPFLHYRLLEHALGFYRALQAEPGLTQLPPLPGRALRAGDSYAGAEALRRRLRAVGDLAPAVGADPGTAIDPALDAALMRFQERHGLNVDGILGRQTFAVLTTPMAVRVRQIELTLERWRWLPAFTAPPIIVNIPQFRLFAFPTVLDRAAGLLQMPVIVGEAYPRTSTPVFTGSLTTVVFRPYWDVPRSITLREMLPQIRAHPGYLARNHLELVAGQRDASPVVAPSPAAIAALAAGRLRLRQRPGADNALGLIKFIFPNAHDVYMHSTPARHLFARSRRAFSHGCIRVSEPVALARYVLRQGPGVWDDARIEAAMNGADAMRVTLPHPVPVMILYGTAVATESGRVLFFDDIYGQDRKLEALLRR
ncbi:MAG: L,D-transpeptidase family protein [Gammaproteobacteria bacterium]|nr:L,D-transpeptidase family protein [Gammaproteobacteria bacterium]